MDVTCWLTELVGGGPDDGVYVMATEAAVAVIAKHGATYHWYNRQRRGPDCVVFTYLGVGPAITRNPKSMAAGLILINEQP